MTPEGEVKREVKKWLVARGYYYFMPMQNGMGRTGIPDFIICANGRFVAIETKAPGKRSAVTANQQRELSWINQVGGVAVVIDGPSQLEDLDRVIDSYDR